MFTIGNLMEALAVFGSHEQTYRRVYNTQPADTGDS